MKPVRIAELKNRLSYYLCRVQRGESVLVAGGRSLRPGPAAGSRRVRR